MTTKITATVRVEGAAFAHTSSADVDLDGDDESTIELPTKAMAESCRDMLVEHLELVTVPPKVLS